MHTFSTRRSYRRARYLAWACATATAVFANSDLAIDIDEYVLRNGLRVVLSHDPKTPVVAVCVTYDVGSRCEARDIVGLAHLVEHIMYRGSENVLPGYHARRIRSFGGLLNATTNAESTSYYQAVPDAYLNSVLALEADRMRALRITQNGLNQARSIVREEYRHRINRSARGHARSEVQSRTAGSFSYGHSTLGDLSVLNQITVEQTRHFWESYYGPNNAVLSIVGNFNQVAIRKEVDKNFGPILPRPNVLDCHIDQETPPASVTYTVTHPRVRYGLVTIGFRVPRIGSKDWYAVGLAGDILADGNSSTIGELLAGTDGILRDISWSIQHRRGGGVGFLQAAVRHRKDLSRAKDEVLEAIRSAHLVPIREADLRRVKFQLIRATSESLRRSHFRAIALGQAAVLQGSAMKLSTMIPSFLRVNRRQIQVAIRQYLQPELATVVLSGSGDRSE